MNFEAFKEQLGEGAFEEAFMLGFVQGLKDAIEEAFILGVTQGIKQAQEWRPIETAPKGVYSATCTDSGYVDPPKILLYTQEGIVIASWDYYYDSAIGGHGYDGNQTAWVTEEGGLVEYQCGMPTHWMPLPPEPKEQ